MKTTHTDAVQILSSIWKSLWNRLVQQKRECESPCRTTATMTAMAAAALMTNSPAQTYWRCESLGKFFVLRHRLGAKIQPKIFQYCCCRLCVWMVCVLCAGPPMCECLAVAIAVDCIRKLLRYTYTKVYILHWWLSVCRFISLAASCHFSRSKRFILDYYDCCCCCWLVCALLQICSVECFFYFCARVWMWPNRKRFVRVRFLDSANIDALSLTCSVSHPAVGSLSSAHTEYQMALCMCDGALVRSTAGLPMYLRVHKNFFYRFGHRIGWLSEWVCIHLVVFTKKSTLMSAYGKTFIAGPELCKNLLTGGARRATRKS